ncbi:hypothetical protein DFH06DRAFT_1419047 [Mycena polygramma]|nr:hypothetical protein DFH06DRAFT_1419047 [Mycena polygramma]
MAVVCEHCGHRNLCSSPFLFTSSGEPTSNYSPARLRSDLDEVASEIERHKAYLMALEERQHGLETELARIVYPVLDNIPPEIMAKIFIACLPSHRRVRPSAVAPPLTLAQICRYWREIALSCRELWSSVDILLSQQFEPGTGRPDRDPWYELPPTPVPDPPNYGALPMLEMWFARAKEQPISLTIRSTRGELPAPLLALISATAGRLYRLELRLSAKDLEFLGQNPPAFPRLKQLAIFSKDTPPNTFDPVRDAPSLSELRVEHDYPSISYLPPRLTSLELGRMHIENLPDLLNRCPQLLHLTVDMGFNWLRIPMTVPHLQSLNFRGSTLDSMNFPCLRRLEVDIEYQSALPDIPYMIHRSGCVLQHLGLKFKKSESRKFVECLHDIPSLTSLHVVVQDIFGFADVMTMYPTLLPRLCDLVISTPYAGFDYLPFVQILDARYNAHSDFPTRLRSVRLKFHDASIGNSNYREDWMPSVAINELAWFVEQGLDLQVGLDHVMLQRS